MTAPNFDTAYAMAMQLSGEGTDHNELAKASTYLNQTLNRDDFFTWLDWMASPSVSQNLARSKRTPEYFKQISGACRQLKGISFPDDSTEDDKAKIMAQTLAWAVRLMRYMPVAQPIDGIDSLAFNQGADKGSRGGANGRSAASNAPAKQPRSIRDLKPGMKLEGTVKRTTNFGAFVDVGVNSDGLVHVSKLKNGFVSDVESVVQSGQRVTVWVEDVNPKQRRIGLTMIEPASPSQPRPKSKPAPETSSVDWEVAPAEETSSAQVQPSQPSRAEPDEGASSANTVPPTDDVAATPKPPLSDKPSSLLAVTLTNVDDAMPGLLVKGTIRRVETNRILVDIGLERDASITFDRLVHIFDEVPTDIDEVAEELPAGTDIEATVLRISKKGVVQLALHP